MGTSAMAGEANQPAKHLVQGQQAVVGPWDWNRWTVEETQLCSQDSVEVTGSLVLSGTSVGGINTDQVRAWRRSSALNDVKPVVAFWHLQAANLSLGQWWQRCA